MADLKALAHRVLNHPRAQRIIASATDPTARAEAIDRLRDLIPIPARWFVNRQKFQALIEAQIVARMGDVSARLSAPRQDRS